MGHGFEALAMINDPFAASTSIHTCVFQNIILGNMLPFVSHP